MNLILVMQGSIEIVISILTSIFIFLMSFKVFSLLTRDIDEMYEIKQNNISVSLLGISFVFGIMLLVKTAIGPSMDTLSTVMSLKTSTVALILLATIRILAIYIISAILAFIILWLAVKFFLILTNDIDEMAEVKKNNLAISILIGTFIISIAYILSSPLSTLLNSFVQAPVIGDAGTKNNFINMSVFSQGLIELGISIVGSIFGFFISFKIFNIFTKNFDESSELKNNNIAIAIVLSAFIFGIMILVKATLAPANETLGFALSSSKASLGIILFAVLRIALFFIITIVIAFILIWITMLFFMKITKDIEEMEEIKNNNIAVSLIIAVLIISVSLLLESGVTSLLNGLIKTPEIGKGLMDISNIK